MGAAEDAARPLSVLVVDDDTDTVESTVTLLELHGFRATGALGCRAAVGAADAARPDVALIDLAMPGGGGCELARLLKLLMADRPPVLVAVTGLGSGYDRQRAAEAGFTCYLVKPIPPNDLVAELRAYARARGCAVPAGQA